MGNIWIDILTPKQVMLFGGLAKELEKEHELLITTREYKETNELLDIKDISTVCIGKHGGGNLEKKLGESIGRMQDLKELAKNEKPDVLLSLSSPEASRIAFGLQIPHVCVNDIPEAEAVTRLTAPLATVLVAPKLIPKSTWLKYGVSESRIVQYDALDPVAWLRGFNADEKVLGSMKIDRKKPIITFRTEEVFASYLSDKVKGCGSLVLPIVNELMEKADGNFIVLPRYREQREAIEKMLSGGVIIPSHAIDGPSLLYYSNIFIGSGGTMNLEAALLGTPTISCRPISTLYEDYAIEKGLIIRASREDAGKKALDMLENNGKYKDELKNRVDKLMRTMEDPAEVIKKTVLKFVK